MDQWEVIVADSGTYRQRWECEPPGPIGSGIGYVVTRQTWNRDLTERVIHEWQPCEFDGPGGDLLEWIAESGLPAGATFERDVEC